MAVLEAAPVAAPAPAPAPASVLAAAAAAAEFLPLPVPVPEEKQQKVEAEKSSASLDKRVCVTVVDVVVAVQCIHSLQEEELNKREEELERRMRQFEIESKKATEAYDTFASETLFSTCASAHTRRLWRRGKQR